MSYDSWKTTEPDYSHPDDDTTCPHGEDGHPICAGWVREYERRASKERR